MPRVRWYSLVIMICLVIITQLCHAGAVLKPNGDDAMPVFTRSVDVKADISGQFASTTMVMVFQNESDTDIEADFIYALQPGAVATYFAYWAGDEKVEAKIVEKKEAAAIYQHLTSYSRDPALIEFTGKSTFRVRISPVPANQDLKVEIHYVEPLTSNGDSMHYSVPIGPAASEQSDPLESVHAVIRINDDNRIKSVSNNYGLPVISDSGPRIISINGRNYRPAKDLAVRILREHKPLRVEMQAEPGSGIFSMALTPDQSLRNPRVRITGLPVSMMTPARLPDAKAGHALIVNGCYKGSGAASVTLSGQSASGRKSYTVPIQFTASAYKGIASKLWASSRMRDLGSKRTNRRSVLNLSFKYGLPSRYTSWLAVPKAETQQLQFEKIEPKLTVLAQKMVPLIADGKMDSPEYQALGTEYDKLTALFDEESTNQALANLLWEKRYEYINKIAKIRFEDKNGSPEEATLRVRVERISTELSKYMSDYALEDTDKMLTRSEQELIEKQYHNVAGKMLELTIAGKHDTDEAKKLEAQYQVLNKRLSPDSYWTENDLYKELITDRIRSYASNIVNENHKIRPNKKVVTVNMTQMNRLASSIKYSPDADLKRSEKQWAQDERWTEGYAYAESVAVGKIKEANFHLQKYNNFSKLANVKNSKDELVSIMQEHFSVSVMNYSYAMKHKTKPAELRRLRQSALRLAKATGESLNQRLKQLDSEQIADRMYTAASNLTNELNREHPFRSRVERLNKDTKAITAELKASYAKEHLIKEAKDFNAAADQSISAWLEEQQVKAQKQSGTVDQDKLDAATKIRREKQEKLETSLYYIKTSIRGGDPLISVEAPENALKVLALLPDGSIKDLVWNKASARWEARFDVPTGTPDGGYVVKIIIMMADGTRRYSSVNFKVDNVPPTGTASALFSESDRSLLRLEVTPSEALARMAALLPWGERVELRKSDDGIYKSSVRIPAGAKPGKIEIIMTDNAHNRGTIYADPCWQ